MPDKWRQKFNRTEIKDKTKQIQHHLSTFAKNSYTTRWTSEMYLSGQIDNLSNNLEEILGEKCKIKYVGSGYFGKVFRINCAGEDLALKIFHNGSFRSNHHGKTKEIANAVYLNHSLKPNQCAKFYCGKVTYNDDPEAFILSQFIPSKKETDFIGINRWEYHRFKIDDRYKDGNIINGKIVDFGGVDYAFTNPAQQKLAKKLYPLIAKGDSEAILKMKEKYKDNADFNNILETIRKMMIELKMPTFFSNAVKNGSYTKKEITAYRALGLDLSAIEGYDYSKAPQEVIDALKKIGLSIKC